MTFLDLAVDPFDKYDFFDDFEPKVRDGISSLDPDGVLAEYAERISGMMKIGIIALIVLIVIASAILIVLLARRSKAPQPAAMPNMMPQGAMPPVRPNMPPVMGAQPPMNAAGQPPIQPNMATPQPAMQGNSAPQPAMQGNPAPQPVMIQNRAAGAPAPQNDRGQNPNT